MKTSILNYLYIFFIVIIFNPKQLSGQDLARDSLLIYHEVIVRIGEHGSFDPYYAFTKDLEKKNHPIYKRFFALYHETLIEKARNQQIPNFVHNRENVFVKMSDLVDPIRSKIVFILPDDFEEPWQFHNGNMITADDLITSIKYAICKGLLSDKIFKNDLIEKEGDYKFSISFNLEFNLEIILRYLEKVYVVPHDYFSEYVVDEKCSENYSIQERPYDIAAGPYKCKNCESSEKILLIRNERYPKRPFPSGIAIKKASMKSDHYGLLVTDGESNIAMDLPAGTITAPPEKINTNRIEGWKVKALFFDYTNPIFQIKEFRKIISKIINVKYIIRQKLDNQANLVTGPYTTLHIGNNPDVKEYLTSEESVRFSKNKTNYIELIKDEIENIDQFNYKGKGRKELYYKDKKVKIIFVYNETRTAKKEKDALDPIIQNLKGIGISIIRNGQQDQTIDLIKSNPKKWDIVYDDIEIQLKDSASEYFMTFNGENLNYHKYSNSRLDELFAREKTTLDPGTLNNIKREIHKVLHDDYAAIFLWTMYNYYAFDKDYISSRNNHLINSVNFFTTPERWKMVRDEY